MYMTIQQILREKNLSRYQLSKISGIPWSTLTDICSGRTRLARCSGETLSKLSAALDIPMEQLMTMTVEQRQTPDGKPGDRSYLEKGLPASLQKALDENNMEEVKSKLQVLEQAMQAASQQMYQQQAQQNTDSTSANNGGKDDFVDAEFEEKK